MQLKKSIEIRIIKMNCLRNFYKKEYKRNKKIKKKQNDI